MHTDREEPTAMAEDRAPDERALSARSRADEQIDEAGRESFPASDPPSTWSGEDRRPDLHHRPVGE